MRKLIIYPNYSMGGVTSVIRGRAAAEPDTQFDVIFLQDRGGRGAFDDFNNVDVRVCNRNRIENLLAYQTRKVSYDEISVLSDPEIANVLTRDPESVVTYEFHSSAMNIVKKEIEALNLNDLARLAAPSETMVEQISALLPKRYRMRLQVVPNLVDSTVFAYEGPTDFLGDLSEMTPSAIPLVWVGRFDMGKGYRYFLRLLAKLPKKYVGFVVVSLEDDPRRPAEFLSEAAAMGVADRVRILSNLSRRSVANLYRSARDMNGSLISTSLMESFGYSVAEALTCGLRVAAFELPSFAAFSHSDLLQMVDIGSVSSLASAIVSSSDSNENLNSEFV